METIDGNHAERDVVNQSISGAQGALEEGPLEERPLEARGPELDVCLASPFFHPEYSGGAERFRRYAPGLEARGIRMHVMAATVGAWQPHRRYASGTPSGSDQPGGASDVPVHRVPMPLRSQVWHRMSILRRVGRWRNTWIFESAILQRCREPSTRPDLLIWRYPPGMTSIRALVALRRMGIPMMRVVTMFKDARREGLTAPVGERLFPVPYRFLDCVVVSSGAMRDNLQKRGVESRVEVVPHGVDLARFHPLGAGPASAPVRKRLGLSPEDEVVLFIGSISRRKGADYLAAAWDRVAAERPRAHLVLVGHEKEPNADEGPSFADRVRGTLRSGRGAGRVTFTGPVDDVEEYIRAADLFVLPSQREGMPNVVLEAFATGVPCVLTPFRGLPEELGRPGRTYVLVDHDVDLLGEAISTLLADESRRRELGDAALRWVRDHLDVQKSLDRLAGVCRDVVRRSAQERMG
jgi:glycosyltransferase involved in cell wall biosynthesis